MTKGKGVTKRPFVNIMFLTADGHRSTVKDMYPPKNYYEFTCYFLDEMNPRGFTKPLEFDPEEKPKALISRASGEKNG